ncbi:hypothetical protein KIN20_018716 [Parelaphostrongylus tenuis]|uniref:Uncharacterized protein n=1 Tax=Parelaphostrongylus tenuis TaxID=148309 RepID=A0AAD5N7V1_PARTN|nr:hypothetical protein KIN20_018716 [Parelaphostrongylus tenuis]
MDKCFEVLNGQSEHIRFTRESPNGGWLPFLNTQESKMNIARIFTDPFMLSLLAVISTVLGCGVLSTGQAQVSGIATSKRAAQGFVQRLVMQTVRWQRFNYELFLIR